jgi:hypothetical protein
MERGIDVNGVPKMVLHVNEDEGHSADEVETLNPSRRSTDENEALLGAARQSKSGSSKDNVDESEHAGVDKKVKKRKKRGGKGKGKKKTVGSPDAGDGVQLE